MWKIFFYILIGVGGGAFFVQASEGLPATSSRCQASAPLPMLVCKEGGDLLCLNGQPGSVKENYFILKGRLNLQASSSAQFSVSIQHEYTKELFSLTLGNPTTQNCWESPPSAEKNFCLEEEGKFSVYVPLKELGPYVIFVTAASSSGNPVQQTVRVSSVIVPTVTEDVIQYEPSTTHIRVILDLLAGCGESKEACDFIGSTTRGVRVVIQNTMGPPAKTVRCETDAIQGGAGRFVIGVPVEKGANQLTISICNAATGFDTAHCPKITPPPFQISGEASRIEILSPGINDPLLWDQKIFPTIPLRFRVTGLSQSSCDAGTDESVQVRLNVGGYQNLCPDAQGIYAQTLKPEVGYNIAQIQTTVAGQKIVRTIPFGWGNPLPFFDKGGAVLAEEKRRLSNALKLQLSKHFLDETILAKLNAFFASEDLNPWLEEVTKEIGYKPIAVENDPLMARRGQIQEALGYCPKSGGFSGIRFRVMRPPHIASIQIEPFQLDGGKIRTKIRAQEVSAALQMYKDANGDARPDFDPLPLKIGFREVTLEPVLEPWSLEGKKMWRLSSAETDCSYKRAGACLKMPALLSPKKFRGNANNVGFFIVCDTSQKISAEIDKVCEAFNILNRQTQGGLQEKILDAMNASFACQGGANFALAFEKGISLSAQGIQGRIFLEAIEANVSGITLAAGTLFGEEETLQQWPEILRKRGAGILIDPQGTGFAPAVSLQEGILFDFSLPMISQMFGGFPGSLTIDEAFFAERGINFEERCKIVEGEKLDPLCNIRPRAKEILDQIITDYGYLQPTDPVWLQLTPSQAFPLRVSVVDAEKALIEISFADWDLAIGAKEESLIVANVSAKIVAAIEQADPSIEDPDHYIFKIRLLRERSGIWLSGEEGTNRTVIPDADLLSTLRAKLEYAIDSYSKEGNEISIPLDRFIPFPSDSIFSEIGLEELTWGRNGLELSWTNNPDRVLLKMLPILK